MNLVAINIHTYKERSNLYNRLVSQINSHKFVKVPTDRFQIPTHQLVITVTLEPWPLPHEKIITRAVFYTSTNL